MRVCAGNALHWLLAALWMYALVRDMGGSCVMCVFLSSFGKVLGHVCDMAARSFMPFLFGELRTQTRQ